MSTSNPRLANHMAAPICAAFFAEMRHAFGKLDERGSVVRENMVSLGNATHVIEQELVTYSRQEKLNGKTVYTRVAFMVGRVAE